MMHVTPALPGLALDAWNKEQAVFSSSFRRMGQTQIYQGVMHSRKESFDTKTKEKLTNPPLQMGTVVAQLSQSFVDQVKINVSKDESNLNDLTSLTLGTHLEPCTHQMENTCSMTHIYWNQ